jgi:hypothetical protein
MKSLMTLAVVTLVLSSALGCGETTTSQGPSAEGMKYLLNEEPTGAVGVSQVVASIDDGQPVVVKGHIGGANNPWIEGRAAFVILDTSKVVVGNGQDSGEQQICLDDCCAADRASCTTLVKLVDAGGKVVNTDARELLGVSANDLVVVRGKSNKDESGNVTILADAVYVAR